MRRVLTILALTASLAAPASAQEGDADTEQGFSLMEEGARMIMRGLMSEMAPTIDGLRGSLEELGPVVGEFVREMGPGLAAFLNRVDDVRHYALPEFLPNGDIILRRKPDAPIWTPEPERDGGEIEL